MESRGHVSVTIEPGSFDSVVLVREGQAVSVLTSAPSPAPPPPAPPRQPPPQPPPGEPQPPPGEQRPWRPLPLPPPARALRVALVEGLAHEVLGRPLDFLRTIESAELEVPLAERASPETTVLITVHGTNLVDFDDAALGRQLTAAASAGADVVIRLVE